MISGFCKLAPGAGDARIISDIDFQKGRFPAVLQDLIHGLEAGFAIPRADEYMKSLSCKLTRDLVTNSLVRSRDQCCLHVRSFCCSSISRAAFPLISGSNSGA